MPYVFGKISARIRGKLGMFFRKVRTFRQILGEFLEKHADFFIIYPIAAVATGRAGCVVCRALIIAQVDFSDDVVFIIAHIEIPIVKVIF